MADTDIIQIFYIFPDPVKTGQFAIIAVLSRNIIPGIIGKIAQIFMRGMSDLQGNLDRVRRGIKGLVVHGNNLDLHQTLPL